MHKKLSGLIALFMLFGVSSALAQKVNVDWDKSAEFSKYKTYAWLESKNRAPNDLTHKRIIENIDQQLAAKGFRKVDSNPDTLVVYNAGVKEQVSVQGNGYGYGPRWGGGSVSLTKFVELQATLVVDLSDAPKKELIFRGIATDTISDNSEKNAKKIQKAAEKIFKKYPPQAK